jgi:tyrosine-protein kinase Etk/Wzc
MVPDPLSERIPTILDYWRIIWRGRLMICALVIVSTVAAGVFSKFLPKLYETKTTLLQAREELSGGGFSFGGGGTGGKGGSGSGGGGSGGGVIMDAMGKSSGASQADVIYILFGSRALAEGVVTQLNLMPYYEVDTVRKAMGALRPEIAIQQTPNKAFEIVVTTKDPKMAADIANTAALTLDRLHKEFNVSSSKRARIFVEARLVEKAKKLTEAENALKEFQTRNRLLGTEEQTGGGVMAAADLHGQIVSLQVELAALKEYATPTHPMINQLQAQIQELQHQLDRLDEDQVRGIGKRLKKRSLSQRVFPVFEEAPALALEFLRLSRQVKVEESIYGMLIGMLESSKMAEAKDLPTLQVIDVALVPEYPSKPTPMKYVMLAGAASLVSGILLVLFLDYLKRLRAFECAGSARREPSAGLGSDDPNGNGDKVEVYPVGKEVERLHG